MKRSVITAAAQVALVLAFGVAWAAQANAQGAPVSPGRQVFDKWCAPCHGSGLGKPATAALAFKYKGETPALLEERTDLTPDFVRSMVRTGVYTMPPFRKTEISDGELDALATYLSKTGSATH
jgi:(+)-pinoresinol hydroxylase